MRVLVQDLDLNRHCEHYPDAFSLQRQEESIKENAFPCVKRERALKCEGVAPWRQAGSRCPVLHQGEDEAVVQKSGKLSEKKVKYYSTPEGIVELNKKGIGVAVDRRVALFFQQSILCYKMSAFTFSAAGADDQIGTSSSLKLSAKGKKSVVHKREAAHSSTIPTLIAHAKDGSTPDGFVFLKGGSSHSQHNATIGMHECVNGADELIDGKGNDGKLRAAAVKILNKVAGGLDPVEATKQFIGAFEKEVARTRTRLEEKEEGGEADPRRLVLERYQGKIRKIKLAAEDAEFYDSLIGVVVDADDKKEGKLRDVVYRKRYDVIRLQEVVESRIGKRIADMKAEMGAREGALIEYILLKAFAADEERTILERLLAKTAVVFEEEYKLGPDGTERLGKKEQSSLKSFKTRVENLEKKYSKDIQKLQRKLRADFRELSAAEFSYRAGVFKDLRTKVNDWTQREFVKQYEDTTGYTVSQSWVSRMEQLSRFNRRDPAGYATPLAQRRRYVSLEDAKRCAEVFGVHAGIFLPCLFTS